MLHSRDLGKVVKGSLNEFTDAISKIDIDIRKLKKEVNASIKASEKHLLIVIDDVDRLDKDELHDNSPIGIPGGKHFGFMFAGSA